jgi:hydroxyacylglutathione hydrolase
LLIVRLEVGLLCANAYLVRDEGSRAGVVIDPGAEGPRIVERCRREGLEPLYIVDTHGHVDHAGANGALKEAFPEAPVCIGSGDAPMLTDAAASLAALFGDPECGPPADVLLEDGQELRFGASVLRVVATPGHTPGGICLLGGPADEPQLFCGDLVFRGGVGRTDLPGGDGARLMASIRRRVLTLPDRTVLWPGHGEPTTVGQERTHNPFLG